MVSLVKPITTKITDIKRLFYVQIFWYRNRKFLLLYVQEVVTHFI